MVFYDLSKRFILTLLILGATFLVLIFSYKPFVHEIIALIIIAVAQVAIWEYGKIVKLNRKKGVIPLIMSLGTLVIIGFFFSSYSPRFSLLPVALLMISGVILFLTRFRDIKGTTQLVTKSFFSLCYIAVPLGLLMLILYPQGLPIERDGRWYLFYLLIVTKGADIGAYLGGRLWGRRKLAPILSPKKTVEGALIGLVVSILLSYAFYFFSSQLPGFYLGALESGVLGVLFGCLGQIGDLAESLLKREAGVKDSNSLPGLGGVLDVLDSLLLTAPILYFFLYMF